MLTDLSFFVIILRLRGTLICYIDQMQYQIALGFIQISRMVTEPWRRQTTRQLHQHSICSNYSFLILSCNLHSSPEQPISNNGIIDLFLFYSSAHWSIFYITSKRSAAFANKDVYRVWSSCTWTLQHSQTYLFLSKRWWAYSDIRLFRVAQAAVNGLKCHVASRNLSIIYIKLKCSTSRGDTLKPFFPS